MELTNPDCVYRYLGLLNYVLRNQMFNKYNEF